MSEEEILYFRFLDGDTEALEKLVIIYRNRLIIFINSYVNNLYDAEDLAEDVFVQIIVKKPSFKRKCEFKTWLFSVARHLAINHVKRTKRTIPYDDVSTLQPSVTVKGPDELLIINENKRDLYEKLILIKYEYRQVIVLSYFEGFSNNEIAFIMKKTKHQVENLLYRAKNALKNKLIKAEDNKLEEL